MSSRLVLVIEDEKIEIVRLKSARKIPVRFRVYGLRRTRRIDLELLKLQSQELPLFYVEIQYSCDNPMALEYPICLLRYPNYGMSQEGHRFDI